MTSRNTLFLLWCVLAAGFAMHGERLECRGDSPAEKSVSVAAAQKRQDAARSVEVVFGIKEVWTKGSLKFLDPEVARSNAVLPPTDTALESVNRLVLDGNKVRFEDNHPTWFLPQGRIDRTPRLRVRDDQVSVMSDLADAKRKSASRGAIYGPSVVPYAGTWTVAPLMITFRGADDQLSLVVVSKIKPAGVKVTIDGSQCDEYLQANGRSKRLVWLDPEKDHVVRRTTTLYPEGKLWSKCDIQYNRSPTGMWVTKSWVTTTFSPNGEVIATLMADVRSVVIGNRPDEEFDTTLAPGTGVYDGRNRKQYVVEPGGAMVEVNAKGQPTGGATVPQPGARWLSTLFWVLACIVGAVFSIGGWFAWRRARSPLRRQMP
ncbi:MAG: hypothetical protein U0746_19775 [Gemmataceae bacterium]